MKIIIIGTGNVATVFSRLFHSSGHEIKQVYGRDLEAAALLAKTFNATYCSVWKDIRKDADLYLAALSDKALSSMAEVLKLSQGIIVHTAGSVPAAILQPVATDYGVIYPLQSIRKELSSSSIPLLVTGSSEKTKAVLLKLASDISNIVAEKSDEEREKLHVAAVVVNNFTNHLYALAEDYCAAEGLDFKLLVPLITETADRLNYFSPKEVVTGPAIRKDKNTIHRHLELLTRYPELNKLYQLFSTSISNMHTR